MTKQKKDKLSRPAQDLVMNSGIASDSVSQATIHLRYRLRDGTEVSISSTNKLGNLLEDLVTLLQIADKNKISEPNYFTMLEADPPGPRAADTSHD